VLIRLVLSGLLKTSALFFFRPSGKRIIKTTPGLHHPVQAEKQERYDISGKHPLQIFAIAMLDCVKNLCLAYHKRYRLYLRLFRVIVLMDNSFFCRPICWPWF